MKLHLKKDVTSQILEIFIQDTRLGDGGGLTGLVHNSAGLTCYYHRNTATSAVAVTLVDMTVGSFTSSGFKVVDGTNMPGVYQLCVPDAAFATGAESVVVLLKGAANMAVVTLEIQLIDLNLKATIPAQVWDELMSSHLVAGTFGRAQQVIRDGTAQAGAAGTITLDAGANATDDFYNNTIIHIVGGTGAGQSRVISDYVGSTKVATVNGNWVTNPSSDSVFVIRAFGAIPGASAPTAAEVADAVWDEDATAHQTQGSFGQAIGDPVADADTIWGLVNTNLNATVSSRASQTSVDTIDDFVDTEIAAIKAKTDQLTFTNANKVDSAVLAGADFAQAAADKVWSSATRTLTALGASLVQEIWDRATSALTTAGSIGKLIVDNLDALISSRAPASTALSTAQWTSTRAGYLDNLNVGGLVASSAEVTVIQNNTGAARIVMDVLERPDAGSIAYRIELFLYDTQGNMEAPDSTPTISVVNQAGTSRDANLDSTTMSLVETGRYRSTYTVDTNHLIEQLIVVFSVVEGGATRKYANTTQVVDTTAVDFTAADRTKLDAIHGKLPSKTFLTGTANSDGDVQLDEMTGGLNATAKLDVNAEVDTALDTVIPGTPTANSINERVKAIDDKLPSGTISDFDEAANQVIVATNNDKTGYRLSATGVTDILGETMNEPAAIFAWPASLRTMIPWLALLARNVQTLNKNTGVAAVRNDANSANVATMTTSDDGTVFTKGEWS